MKIEEAKKELIKNKKYVSGCFDNEHCKQSFNDGIDLALDIIDQTEPYQPKPVVPQFVAEWYEEHKEDLEYDLYFYQMSIYDLKAKKDDFYYWMQKTNNPVHKLINMHQYGYTVEKEKLYTVEIPNLNGCNLYLIKLDKEVVITSDVIADVFPDNLKLTEQEIRKDYDWAFRWAKEVTE